MKEKSFHVEMLKKQHRKKIRLVKLLFKGHLLLSSNLNISNELIKHRQIIVPFPLALLVYHY